MILYLLVLPEFVMGETLTLSYLERPPYYHTEQGRADGFLIELSKKIFQDAGVEVIFERMPPKRIMMEIKRADSFHCSVGWFKKPEREKFAKFSLPIYQNRPVAILTTKKQKHLFAPHTTLREVFSDKSLIMATMSAFSYGSFIDQLMKDISPKTHEISSKQKILPKLIMKGRAAYMLTAPEEVETLVRSAGLNPDDFVSITMPDIPAGNRRYLIFSKGVSNEIVERINTSVRKFVNHDILD
jgi:polar amino acid transport system substrate-binding protein